MSSLLFLGVSFSNLSIYDATNISKAGGLILAPSGPGLADLDRDFFYMKALLAADIILADSGLAILLMRILGLGNLKRASGLGYLQHLLMNFDFKSINSFY